MVLFFHVAINYAIAFCQVTGSNDFTLKLWDAKTGTEKYHFLGNSSAVNGVAYKVSLKDAKSLKFLFHDSLSYQRLVEE